LEIAGGRKRSLLEARLRVLGVGRVMGKSGVFRVLIFYS